MVSVRRSSDNATLTPGSRVRSTLYAPTHQTIDPATSERPSATTVNCKSVDTDSDSDEFKMPMDVGIAVDHFDGPDFRHDQYAAERIIEHYAGRVERIEGNTGYISLTSPSGDELFGEYPSEKLLALNIIAGEAFDCDTVETAGGITVTINKRRRIPLTEDMVVRLRKELHADFAGLE